MQHGRPPSAPTNNANQASAAGHHQPRPASTSSSTAAAAAATNHLHPSGPRNNTTNNNSRAGGNATTPSPAAKRQDIFAMVSVGRGTVGGAQMKSTTLGMTGGSQHSHIRAASAGSHTAHSGLPALNSNNNNDDDVSPIYDVSSDDLAMHDVPGWKVPSKKVRIPGALPRHVNMAKIMQRATSPDGWRSPQQPRVPSPHQQLPHLRPGSVDLGGNESPPGGGQHHHHHHVPSRPTSAAAHLMRFRPGSASAVNAGSGGSGGHEKHIPLGARRASATAVSAAAASLHQQQHHQYSSDGDFENQLQAEIARQNAHMTGIDAATFLAQAAPRPVSGTGPSPIPGLSSSAQQQQGRSGAAMGPVDSVDRVMSSVAMANDRQWESSMSAQRNRPKIAPSDVGPISKLQTLDDVSTLYSDHARSYTPVKFVRMQLLPQKPGDKFNPYDLRVVHPRSDGVEVPLDDYCIVSASGVVRVTQSGASHGDVISLSEFVREASVFRMLTKIPFFARYLLLKAFSQWHKNIRLRLYMQTRRRTAENFFLAQSVFAKPLCFFREQAAVLASQQLVQMPDNREGVTRERFAIMTSEKTHKVSELFRTTLDENEARLKGVCDEVVQRADIPDLTSPEALTQYIKSLEEEEMRAGGNARRVSAKAMSMAKAKENEIRRMGQLKAAMSDLQQLPRFVRLVDSICAEALFSAALRSVLQLFHELHRRDDDRCLFFLTATTFDCDPQTGIAFFPSEDLILSMLQDITTEMISVVTGATRLATLRTFRDFFTTVPRVINMGTALQHDERVRSTITSMRRSISDDFRAAREVTKPYAENRRWFEFVCNEWPVQKEEWQQRFDAEQQQKDLLKSLDPSLEGARRPLEALDFARTFHQIDDATSSLKSMLTVRRGSLIVTSAAILETLINGLKSIQSEVKTRLTELAGLRLLRLENTYETRRKLLIHEKTTNIPLAKFAAFAQTVDNIAAEDGRLGDIAAHVEELMECAVTNLCDCQKENTKREMVLGGAMAALGAGGNQSTTFRDRYETALQAGKDYRNNSIKEMNRKLDIEVENEREIIFNTISSVDAEVMHAYRPATETQEAIDHLEVIRQNIESSDQKFKTFISWQKIFGVASADLGLLDSLKAAYKQKNELWSTITRWNELRQETYLTPVVEVNMTQYIKHVDEIYTLTYAKIHNRNKNEASEKLLESLREEKMLIPTLQHLGNPHLGQEHWQRILASQQRVYDPSLTLDTLKQLRMFEPQFREIIAEQSAIATGEHSLMETVEAVRQRWGEIAFAVKKHREQKDTFILDDVAEIVQVLEEDTLTIQSCLMNRFVASIRDRVETWERKLVYLGQTIEEWINVQSAWMYLEAIFASEDITKQLPEESVMFKGVDQTFRALLQRTHQIKICVTVVAEGDILDLLKRSRETLDLVQKRLEEYLETKRAAFPRFYFLSNDELLQILSDSRDTRAVRPHLMKCFESMKDIHFNNDAGTEITAMISPDGEAVPFFSVLYARGPVEGWLLQLERTMVSCLRQHMQLTMKGCSTMKRIDWIMNVQGKDHRKSGMFPAQCTQCVDMVQWTADCEEAIAANRLVEYNNDYQKDILLLVAAVRANLTPLHRSLIGTLLVIDVHNRDTVRTLIEAKVEKPTDFEWTIQMRYYPNGTEGDVDIHHVNAVFDYSFEYLGSAKRLVITPLTDRAFLTCTGALHMNLGGAPQGPAGTGKTESVKDLGKALSRQVVVFNCISSRERIDLADGTSILIADLPDDVEDHHYYVNAHNGKSGPDSGFVRAQITKKIQSRRLRDVLRVSFIDGRTITCTPDHQFLLADGTYVAAKDLATNENKKNKGVMLGHAATPRSEMTDADRRWSLGLVDSNGKELAAPLTLNSPKNIERTLVFARVLGFALSAGHFPAEESNEAASLFLLNNNNVNLTMQPCSWPTFVTENDCPLIVLQAFLSGVYGGNGCIPPLSALHGDRDERFFGELGFSQSVDPQHVASLRKGIEQLRAMLARFDIDSYVSVDGMNLDGKTHQVTVKLGAPRLTADFMDKIGFAYCGNKRVKAGVAASYYRYHAECKRQYAAIMKSNYSTEVLVDELDEVSVDVLNYDNIMTAEHWLECVGAEDFFDNENENDNELSNDDNNSLPAMKLQVLGVEYLAEQETVFDVTVEELHNFTVNGVAVHNCSDSLSTRMMSQMFSGLAQGGAWACFDEFNRIELEVLSVIAQQMMDITSGVAQKLSRMVFDGRDVRLHKNFGVFITMNPGYAGRTELPDNLKALFRPCCFAAGTPVLMADYSTKPIEEVKAGDRVMTWDRDTQNNNNNTLLGGMVPTTVKALLNQGEKPVVELTFFDGRSVVCTSDHRFLLADGTWCRANEIPVVAQTAATTFNDNSKSVMMGVRGTAQRSFTDSEMKWMLPLADLQCNTPAAQERTLAFARIAGYIMTATNNKKECVAVLGSELDAQQLVSDCRRYFGDDSTSGFEMQTNSNNNNNKSFSVKIRNELQVAFSGMQKQQKKDSALLPDFVLDRQCPVPVVAQFLAGFFGANCTSPTLTKSGFSAPSISQSGCCAKMLRSKMQQIQALLARCGVTEFDTVTEESKPLTRAGCCNCNSHLTITLKASPQQQQQEKNNFYDNIGILYSAEKQHRFAVVNAWQQTQATVSPKEFLERIGATHIFNNKKNTVSAASQPLRNQLLGRRELSGIRTVYDLSVEHHSNGADNSFLVNGMVAHNCMMVPNYQLIAEIMFFSEGFGNAPVLAKKMVQLYKLSSEQLSKQDHYDFGMRAVKSILVMAGSLKRAEPNADEDMLLTRALRDSNIPKFLRDDAKLFNALINDLYPEMDIVDADNTVILHQLHKAMAELVVEPIPSYTEKILMFHETTIVRHGVMLVGESLSGKTTCLQSLQKTLGALSERADKGEVPKHPFFRPAHQYIVNPKSVTRDELYGALNPVTREWQDGSLSKIVRHVLGETQSSDHRRWLVFDGPVDALWIENMNTVLDDNKMLCLVNGERLKFPDTVSFIFEVQDLKVASPATVSRCGMVYFEAFAIDGGWRPMLKCFNQRLGKEMAASPPELPPQFGGRDPNNAGATGVVDMASPPASPANVASPAGAASAAVAVTTGVAKAAAATPAFEAPNPWDTQRIYDLAFKLIEKYESSGVVREVSEWVPNLIAQQTRSMLLLLEAVVRRIKENDDDAVDPALPKPEKDEDGRELPVDAVLIAVERDIAAHPEPIDSMKVTELVDMYVLFSFVWAFGGNLAEKNNSRERFSNVVRIIIKTVAPQVRPLPDDGSVFDYFVRKTSGSWSSWKSKVPKFLFRPEAPFFELLVPTAESVATESIASLVLRSKNNVLVSGSTGTGKSVGMVRLMFEELKTEDANGTWMAFTSVLSAQTSSKQLQEKIEGRLRKHPSKAGSKNVCLGPAPGKTMLAFIDDINMPFVEEYGATPPLELLRQLLVQGGWYSRSKKSGFMDIIDTVIAACCGPPGGGRNEMPQRLTSRFFLLCQPALARKTCHTIFRCILHGFTGRNFHEDIRGCVNDLVGATLDVYEAAAKKFLPRPEKSHYTFNLRDVSRVIQGVMQTEPGTCDSVSRLIRLWAHEAMRVFHDRLVDEKDRDAFSDMLVSIQKEKLGKKEYTAPQGPLTRQEVQGAMYGDFASEEDVKLYSPIEFNASLSNLLMERLAEFSIQYTREMDLVMFPDAVRHLCRISRVLRQPRGNCLLVGVGGSGRQSLAQLAAFVNGMTLFQITITKFYGINEFREDLRNVLLDAGCEYKPTAFVLGGHQILEEQFLEDVNGLLNTGEINSAWAPEDVDRIVAAVRPAVVAAKKPETPNVMMQTFIERCRDCLHIVLTMSPIGTEFRNRIRKFPALVNNMTVDWFSAWPDVALHSVALRIMDKHGTMAEGDREVVAKLCVSMHLSVKESEGHFLATQGRRAYTTPTSYISLLNLVSALLVEQTTQLEGEVRKYTAGVEKLQETNKSVDSMKTQLVKMQPELVKQNIETVKFAEEVDAQSRIASEAAAVVAEEERQCNVITAEAQTLRDECQASLDSAMPAFNQARDALSALNPKDIQETRSFARPPAKVEVVINAVLTILDENLGWENGKKVLGRMNFIDTLKYFNADDVPDRILKKLKKFTVMEELRPEVAATVSTACVSLCLWCHAIENYCEVMKQVTPKKASLKVAEEKYAAVRAILQKKQAELRAVEQKVADLKAQFQASQMRKQQLENEIHQTELYLARAERLLSGLASEEKRWGESLVALHGKRPTLLCTAVLSAAFTAYCGFFTEPYRQKLLRQWLDRAQQLRMPCPDEFRFYLNVVEPTMVRKWQMTGLPNDAFSLDNGAIVNKAQRWCLCVDPQGQANAWIKRFYRDRGIKVIKATDQNIMRTLENCIRQGTPVLLENVTENLDPGLDPILAKQIYRQAGRLLLRMRDGSIEYGEGFFFIMTTRLANPHYVPEVQIKVTLLNFAVTQKGLEEQLLGDVVRHERKELEDKADKLIVQVADSKQQLTNIEEKILHMLSTSSGDLLADEALINTLQESKVAAKDIAENLRVAVETQAEINTAREMYRPVAERGSILFSTVTSIANLEHMYQNALSFFTRNFKATMSKTKKVESMSVKQRCDGLISDITVDSFSVICRGLFEAHKPMFAFLIAADVMRSQKRVPDTEWEWFLRGSAGEYPLDTIENPEPGWLSQQQWDDLCLMGERMPETYENIVRDIVANAAQWRAALTQTLGSEDTSAWGGKFEDEAARKPAAARSLTPFQSLLLFKCICEERVPRAANAVVISMFGPTFLKSEVFELATVFNDSSYMTPVVFVLSTGTDPTQLFVNFAEQRGFGQKKHMLSMGQGQGVKAEAKIQKAMRDGEWVYLQNCHVFKNWMPTLDAIVADTLAAQPHEDYRLWLTTMPCDYFPVSVLQLSIKVTREPPKGLTSNMHEIVSMIVRPTSTGRIWWDEFAPGESHKTVRWRKMLVCLVSMHCITIERRRFGPLGWNIPYDWNAGDLDASIRSAFQFVEMYDALPWSAMRFILADINYGGRVMDALDLRSLAVLLDAIVHNDNIMTEQSEPILLPGGVRLPVPPAHFMSKEAAGFLAKAFDTEVKDNPTAYGLHTNAGITYLTSQARQLVTGVISVQPRAGGSGGAAATAAADALGVTIADLLERMPAPINKDEASPESYRITAKGVMISLGTVLSQEVDRFTDLLKYLVKSLTQLQRALRGEVVMDSELESIAANLTFMQVPKIWEKKIPANRKPLIGWFTDLIRRVDFFRDWNDTGIPMSFWMGSFFFPQGFLTGVLQTHSRQFLLPIDQLRFRAHMTKELDPDDTSDPNGLPILDTGVYIHGLFLEGARWSLEAGALDESHDRELFCKVPVIWLQPTHEAAQAEEEMLYSCPMYKISTRAGVLSTTGISTNYVLPLRMPTGKQTAAHWTMRGTAMLTQLDD